MTSSLIVKIAETDEELEQILSLQNENHVQTLTPENRKLNGFVTVKHDIGLLRKMNKSAQQIIAKDHDVVVGYALVMFKELKEMVPVLIPMFEMFESLSFQEKQLSQYNYYVMGQICISEKYRGQGLFEALYLKHKELFSGNFELCITEVSVNNSRSMKAHDKIGFKTIHNFKDETDDWNIMVWDWGF